MAIGKSIVSAIGAALWSAAACAILATLIYAIQGDEIAREGGIELSQLLLIYLGTAVASGIVIGVLRPITGGVTGRSIVGIVASLPVTFSIMLMSRDLRLGQMDKVDYWIAIAMSVVLGPFVAAYFHSKNERDKSP
jgi:hypothetical protein